MQNDNCQKEIEHDCKYDSMELLFCKQNPSKCVPLCNLFSEAYSIMGFLFYDFARIFIWLCGLLHDFIFLSLLLLNVVVTLCVYCSLSVSLFARACMCVLYLWSWLCHFCSHSILCCAHQIESEHTRIHFKVFVHSYIHTHHCSTSFFLYIIHNIPAIIHIYIQKKLKKEPVFRCVSAAFYGTFKILSTANTLRSSIHSMFCFDFDSLDETYIRNSFCLSF